MQKSPERAKQEVLAEEGERSYYEPMLDEEVQSKKGMPAAVDMEVDRVADGKTMLDIVVREEDRMEVNTGSVAHNQIEKMEYSEWEGEADIAVGVVV